MKRIYILITSRLKTNMRLHFFAKCSSGGQNFAKGLGQAAWHLALHGGDLEC